ncbi:nuclear transport factor 2 family protein [Mycobacterium intracellulare]|uniref:Rv0361 family membrane protein n=1 Tax=Mycobacterium intracellulare TaxID=1767 RepID=UPI001158AAC9|nr:nuclear transport factor 2 family protein [Mycobacterium intracellulare]
MPAAPKRFVSFTVAVALSALTVSCSSVTGGHAAGPQPGASSSATPSPTGSPTPAVVAPSPPSDEDQIRQTVTAFQDAYNTQNWTAYTELMCSAMRAKFTGPVMNYVKKGRAESGLTHIVITSVKINGDTATAAMNSSNEALGARAVSLPLKLEDGWKICQT